MIQGTPHSLLKPGLLWCTKCTKMCPIYDIECVPLTCWDTAPSPVVNESCIHHVVVFGVWPGHHGPVTRTQVPRGEDPVDVAGRVGARCGTATTHSHATLHTSRSHTDTTHHVVRRELTDTINRNIQEELSKILSTYCLHIVVSPVGSTWPIRAPSQPYYLPP